MNPSANRWLRFSLRTVLLLIAAIAIGLMMWKANSATQENIRLRAEIKRLKDEVGELTIEEGQEDKLHAIEVPHLESNTWKWRVWVPKGKTYSLKSECGSFLSSGKVSGPGSQSELTAGEYIVVAALLENSQGQWEILKEHRSVPPRVSASSRFSLPDKIAKLIGNSTSSSGGVGKTATIAEPGKELTLLRYKMFPRDANGASTFDGPADGILVTIKEK